MATQFYTQWMVKKHKYLDKNGSLPWKWPGLCWWSGCGKGCCLWALVKDGRRWFEIGWHFPAPDTHSVAYHTHRDLRVGGGGLRGESAFYIPTCSVSSGCCFLLSPSVSHRGNGIKQTWNLCYVHNVPWYINHIGTNLCFENRCYSGIDCCCSGEHVAHKSSHTRIYLLTPVPRRRRGPTGCRVWAVLRSLAVNTQDQEHFVTFDCYFLACVGVWTHSSSPLSKAQSFHLCRGTLM